MIKKIAHNQLDNILEQQNRQIDYNSNQGIENNSNSNSKDLLIYLHIPFCTRKCTYCCWTAHIPSKILMNFENFQTQFVDSLCVQIQHIGPKLMKAGYNPRHVAWGGGTPSVLSIESLEKVLKVLYSSFDLSGIDEHTFESSPCTLDAEKISFLSSNGVNRVSVGVQSFNDDELKMLGRPHNSEEAINTVSLLRENGICNYNMDLMFAIPNHTSEIWKQTLKQALALDPTHITTYLYNNTPNTVLTDLINKGKYQILPMGEMLELDKQTKQILGERGFYESISQCYITRPEHLHKSEYYVQTYQGDYIGFGNGANSSIKQHFLCNSSDNESINRFIQNPVHFDNCVKYTPFVYDSNIETTFMRILNALCTDKGINFKKFYDHYGFNFEESNINHELLNIAKKTNSFNVSDEGISIKKEDRNIVYIKYLLQVLRIKKPVGSSICD